AARVSVLCAQPPLSNELERRVALAIGLQLGWIEVMALIGRPRDGRGLSSPGYEPKTRCGDQDPSGGVLARRRRVSRFQREAEVLPSLNHPNIALFTICKRRTAPGISCSNLWRAKCSRTESRGPIPVEEALRGVRK